MSCGAPLTNRRSIFRRFILETRHGDAKCFTHASRRECQTQKTCHIFLAQEDMNPPRSANDMTRVRHGTLATIYTGHDVTCHIASNLSRISSKRESEESEVTSAQHLLLPLKDLSYRCEKPLTRHSIAANTERATS